MPALVELSFLRRVTAAAKRRDFLRSRYLVGRRSSGRFPVLDALSMADVATERFGRMRVLQKIGDLLGVASLAERVYGLGAQSEGKRK